MSWWDPFVDYFSGNGDSFADAAGSAASQAGSALSGLGSDIVSGIQDYGSTLGAGLQNFGNSVGSTVASGMGDTSSGALQGATAGDSIAGLASASGNPAAYIGTMGGTAASGMAESGGSGLLDSAKDWAKNNPKLVSSIVDAGLSLMKDTSPSAASKKQASMADQSNANAADIASQKTAVGQSLINQAPGYATNQEAMSKLSGANAEKEFTQRMAQQGYGAGDAQYESGLQQLRGTNRTNDMTAYAQGQDSANKATGYGAGLLTSWKPDYTGYGSLDTQQQNQQTGEQQKAVDATNAGLTAFNIWANPTDKKSDGSTIIN